MTWQAVSVAASALAVLTAALKGALWVYRTGQRIKALEDDVKRLGAALRKGRS